MYIPPRAVKCPKCNFEGFENMDTQLTTVFDGLCPQCLRDFLKANVPRMEPDNSGRVVRHDTITD